MSTFMESEERRALRKAVSELGAKYGEPYFRAAGREGRRTTELWDEAAKTSDDAARTKLYEQMQQIINEESPWAYLYEYNIVVTHRDDVQGYTSYPDALIRFFQLSKTK